MNTKLITKALNSLFQLTDEDRAIVLKLWNLSDAEREQLVEVLGPQKPATKKPAKKRGKSQRATGMATAISDSLERSRAATATNNDNTKCSKCDELADHNLHHLKAHPDHHEFVAPTQSAAVSGGISDGNTNG